VPYEIGSRRCRNPELVFFVREDLSNLPSYLSFGRRILDDFCRWATEVSSERP
jgi:hypothetical protein